MFSDRMRSFVYRNKNDVIVVLFTLSKTVHTLWLALSLFDMPKKKEKTTNERMYMCIGAKRCSQSIVVQCMRTLTLFGSPKKPTTKSE